MKKRGAAGCAGCLESRSRNARDAHARGHVRRQVVLPDKRRAGKIAKIKRFDLRPLRAAVLQRFLSGFYRERTEIAIRECAKSCFPDADDGDGSHTFRITGCRLWVVGCRWWVVDDLTGSVTPTIS